MHGFMKILLVEDESAKEEAIRRFLSSAGYHGTYTASSYRAALEAVMTYPFDLCLLDLSLRIFDVIDPGDESDVELLGGIDLMSEMRRKGREIPTVLVSQYRSFGELMSEKTYGDVQEECKARFPTFYRGAVFYSDESVEWQNSLLVFLRNENRK